MAKRKPGRPRKVAESFEFPEAVKRKPGRPRKIASAPLAERTAPPEPVQALYRYTVKTTAHEGYTDSEIIDANDFLVSGNGDLLLFVDDVAVAAFRQWIGITGEKLPERVVAPEVTLSAASVESVAAAHGLNADALKAHYPQTASQLVGSFAGQMSSQNGALNAAQEFPEAARQREELESTLVATGA